MLTQVTNCFEIMTTIVTKKVCKHGQIRDISYLDRKCEKSRKIHKKNISIGRYFHYFTLMFLPVQMNCE